MVCSSVHAGDPVYVGASRVSPSRVIAYYAPKNELLYLVEDLKEKILALAFNHMDAAGHQINVWTKLDKPCATFCTCSERCMLHSVCCAACSYACSTGNGRSSVI